MKAAWILYCVVMVLASYQLCSVNGVLTSEEVEVVVDMHNRFRSWFRGVKGNDLRRLLSSNADLSELAEQKASECIWEPQKNSTIISNVTYALNQYTWLTAALMGNGTGAAAEAGEGEGEEREIVTGLESAVRQWMTYYPYFCRTYPYPELNNLCDTKEMVLEYERYMTMGCGSWECEQLLLEPFNRNLTDYTLLTCLYEIKETEPETESGTE